MTRRFLTRSCGALLLAACATASAQNAFTSRPMNVRAGPSRYYPLVAQLEAGTPLEVHGCLSDWSWCDVSFDDDRGWIYSGGLSFVYEGGRVPLYAYGPRLGLPIITFSLLPYWSAHYRHRRWYSQRDRWAHRRLPPHLRPPGRAGRAIPRAPSARPPAGARVGPRGEARGRPTPPRRAPRRTSAPRGAQHQQPRRSPERQQPPRGAQRQQPPHGAQRPPPARASQPRHPPDTHGRSARRVRPEQKPPGHPPF